MPTLSPLSIWSDTEIDTVLDAAFGTDRHRRTAYAIRTGMRWLPPFSYGLGDSDGALIALLQSWPVALHGDDGAETPLIMVGPVAVSPEDQGKGLGRALMDRLVADTDATAEAHLMMIGDPEYYGRFWNFWAHDTAGWRAPGPVDPARLLMRPVPRLPALPRLNGMLGPNTLV